MSFAAGDPFQEFRAQREKDQLKNKISQRAILAQEQIRQLIDKEEQLQEINKLVIKEMEEFFQDSTRIAAQVFGTIEEEKRKEIERKVKEEMQAFFHETKQKVEAILTAYLKDEIQDAELDSQFENILNSSFDSIENIWTKSEKSSS